MRKTGISIIDSLPWGAHFCMFYQTKQDLIGTLVPYFKAGLEANEFCMWVTAEPLGVDEAKAALRDAVPDLDDRIANGDIEIIAYTDWYVVGGVFDQSRVLNGWVSKLDNALAKGYEGLRLTGNTFWLEKEDWRSFAEYEAAVQSVIGNYRMLAICTYSVDRCGAAEVADVVANHEFALMKRGGDWVVIESSASKQAKQALAAAVEEREAATIELEAMNAELRAREDDQRRQIADRDLAEKALRASELRFELVFDKSAIAISLARLPAGRLVNVNEAWVRMFGYSKDEAIGKTLLEVGIFRDQADRDQVVAELERAGSLHDREMPYWPRPGGERVLSANVSIVHMDGQRYSLASYEDITDRKIADTALRASEAKYREIFENMTEEVHFWRLVWDESGNIKTWILVDANPPTLKTWGKSLNAIKGKTTDEIFGPGATEHYIDVIRKITTEGVPHTFEDYFPHLDKYFRFTSVPLGDYFITTGADITAIKKSNAELAATRDELAGELAAMKSLHRVSTRFVSQGAMQEVLDDILEAATTITDSRMGNIQILDEESGNLKIRAHRGYVQAFLDFFDTIGEGHAASALALKRKERYISEDVTADPNFVGTPELEVLRAAGIRAVQTTPLFTSTGRLVGMLSTHFSKPHRPQELDLQWLDLLARQSADIIERAQEERAKSDLLSRERRIAEILQTALIPTQIPTTVGGCSFSARYVPALDEASVGGDFYDVFDLGDGKVGVLIGDIAGKGLVAAIRVSAARYAIRSYAFLDPRPCQVITLANKTLCRSREGFGMLTAFYAVVDTTTGSLEYANAGHEPPLIKKADGAVAELTTGGMALGILDSFDYADKRTQLEPGDAVVMVRDGITEARVSGSTPFGQDAFIDHVACTSGATADEIADRLLNAAIKHSGGSLKDDVAVVVLELTKTD